MKKKILYAGTFDPITKGHLDVIKRGSKLADDLVVCIFINSEKTPLFTVKQRIEMIKIACEEIPNIKIDCFEGLLANYVNENNIDIVLRGLRAGVDFEYEISMAQLNSSLYQNKTETIFLMTNPENSFISSSLVREILKFNGEIKGLVPKKVIKYISDFWK